MVESFAPVFVKTHGVWFVFDVSSFEVSLFQSDQHEQIYIYIHTYLIVANTYCRDELIVLE